VTHFISTRGLFCGQTFVQQVSEVDFIHSVMLLQAHLVFEDAFCDSFIGKVLCGTPMLQWCELKFKSHLKDMFD